MKLLNIKNICFLFIILLSSCNNNDNKAVTINKGIINLHDFDFDNTSLLSLDGKWELYPGELLSPSDFENKTIIPKQYAELPHQWGERNICQPMGCATYRLTVHTKDTINQLSLSCDRYYSAIKVFVEGEEKFSAGKPGQTKEQTKEGFATVYFDFAPSNTTFDIIIQLSNFRNSFGGIIHPIYLGKTDKVRKISLFIIGLECFLIGILFITLFYNLVLYSNKHTDRSPLYLALFCGVITIYIFFSGHLISLYNFNLKWELINRIQAISMYLSATAFILFMHSLFVKSSNKKFIYLLLLINFAFILSVSILSVQFFANVFNIFSIYMLIVGAYFLFVYIKGYRDSVSSPLPLFAGLFLLFTSILFDVFFTSYFGHRFSFFLFGILAFIIIKSYIITNNLALLMGDKVGLTQELENFNQNLSSLVEERTKAIVEQSNNLKLKNTELEQQKEELKAQTESIRSAYVEISGQKLEIRQQKRQVEQANLKFRVLFEKSTDAHVLYKRLILDYNDAAIKLFDVENANHLLSQRPSDFAPKNQPDKSASFELFKRKEEEAIDKGMTRFEWTVKTYKDVEKVTEVTLNVIDIDKDKILLAVFHDMTERKKAENEIKAAHQEVMLANQEIIFSNIQLERQKDEMIEQKNIIENKNKDITSSINYASRIQMALLPPLEHFKNLLAESFVFYKPRDIVSGDFYWLKHKGKYIVIAAADCTGHGVPGAFMSMLGVSYLNEIVSRIRLSKASSILEELRDKIKKSLHQEGKEGDTQDGMDIALCIINTETLMLDYAGAHNPLYIIRNTSEDNPFNIKEEDINNSQYKYTDAEGAKLLQIKANKMPIGIYPRERNFDSNRVQLLNNDIIYLFSDGFVDQFGTKDKQKFKSKRFKNLLLNIHNKPMEEQKQIISTTFDNWKGNNMQIDDILVIGLKITFGKRFAFANLIHNWQNYKILIVEDDKLSYLMLEGILKSTKVQILWAKDGKEGVEIAMKNTDIDLILMDIDMPHINGFEAIKKIKSFRSSLPIIIQTTYNSSEQKSKGFEAGCDDFISKPVNMKELFSTLSKYIDV